MYRAVVTGRCWRSCWRRASCTQQLCAAHARSTVHHHEDVIFMHLVWAAQLQLQWVGRPADSATTRGMARISFGRPSGGFSLWKFPPQIYRTISCNAEAPPALGEVSNIRASRNADYQGCQGRHHSSGYTALAASHIASQLRAPPHHALALQHVAHTGSACGACPQLRRQHLPTYGLQPEVASVSIARVISAITLQCTRIHC